MKTGGLFPGAWYDLSCRGKGLNTAGRWRTLYPYRLIGYVYIKQLQKVLNMLVQHLRGGCKSKNTVLTWIQMGAKTLELISH